MAWGRCDDTFYRHAKVGELDPEAELAAIGLYWKAISWSNDQLSDGRVPANVVRMLGGSVALAEELVRVRLWEQADQAYVIHDFADYNRTKAEVLALREQRSLAGKAGADGRWGGDGKSHGKPYSKSHGKSHGEMPNEMHGNDDAPVPGTRSPVPVTDQVPPRERGTWPDDVPRPFRDAWHRRGFRFPPTLRQLKALRDKPWTWDVAARLVDEAPAGADTFDVGKHVLDGLSAAIEAERAEEASRAVEKVPGNRGGPPTKIGDVVAGIGVNGGPR